MRKHFRFIVLAAVIAALSIAPLAAQALDTTLATVRLTDTDVVYGKEMQDQISALEQQLGRQLTKDQKDQVLQTRINTLLIDQAARKAGLTASDQELQQAIAQQKQSLGLQVTDAQFQQMIVQQAGITWDEYLAQLESRILQEKYINYAKPDALKNLPQPTDQEIQSVYEQNAQSFVSPAMSGVSHIYIDTRGMTDDQKTAAKAKMDGFSRRIRNNGPSEFDAIVKESLDDSGFTGGNFGYIVSGDQNALQLLGSTFVQTVLGMQQGAISGVLESNSGYHIVRVDDKRAPKLLELNDPLFPGQSMTVRQNIVNYIMNQRQQQALVQALNEIVTDLRNQADIRVFDENIPW